MRVQISVSFLFKEICKYNRNFNITNGCMAADNQPRTIFLFIISKPHETLIIVEIQIITAAVISTQKTNCNF